MKSLTKSNKSKFVASDVQVQLSLPVAGVLRDVQSAFLGLCVESGKPVLAAMMESERTALCGPRALLGSSRPGLTGPPATPPPDTARTTSLSRDFCRAREGSSPLPKPDRASCHSAPPDTAGTIAGAGQGPAGAA